MIEMFANFTVEEWILWIVAVAVFALLIQWAWDHVRAWWKGR